MAQKEDTGEKQGILQELSGVLTRENKKRLLCMLAGAAVLYFLVPLVLTPCPDEVRANVEVIRLLILNQVFIGVVGWHANYFAKYGIYVPIAFILLFALSEAVFYGMVTWSMEVEYMQTGYIVFFLRKFIARKMAMDEKKKNKPFPKNVTGRK